MATITESGRARRSRIWLSRQGLPARGLVWAATLAGLLEALATIVQMGLIAWLVQAVLVTGSPIESMLFPLALLGCSVLVRSLSQASQTILGSRGSALVRQRTRARLVQTWAALGPVRLAERSSATLANQWAEQVEALDGYYAKYLPQQWLAVMVPLFIGAVVAWLDWLAAVFLFVSAPLIPLFMALVGFSAERVSREHVLEAGRLSGHFLDRVRNLTSLQLFGQTAASVAAVRSAADRYRRVTMRTLRIAFLSSAVLEFFASVAIAVVAMYVGFGLLGYIEYGPSPELTLFSGLFILLLAPEFFQPLRLLAQHYHDRAAALGAADALADLESIVPDPDTVPDPDPDTVPASPSLCSDAAAVVAQDLCLGYPGRGRVLSQIDLRIERGETVVLTGPSGSGKSSLLHCVAGFIRPDAGLLAVFGRTAGSQPVAWIGQRPFLIKGSWADNLRLTAPQADEHALRHAIAAVGLGEVLAAQPDGLDSLLGENGRGLSGGQAQRLALARVWLAESELVLLDEPTASLDEDSEALVVEALKALAASGRTLLIATHHPALMNMASRRMELQQGRLTDV